MDFFEHQTQARRATGWLLVYFILAIAATIAAVYALVASIFLQDQGFYNPVVLGGTIVGTILLFLAGSLYKSIALRQGGETVALMLGGRRIPSDSTIPEERRLLNIVEEMSIASGTPVPPVFVMDNEPGINAFAAGFSTSDSVISVNRGTLDLLSRDELQGVVAHEFSHILNGDMRLNLRLMGWLNGLLMVFLAGRIIFELILRSGSSSSSSRINSNSNDDNKKGGDPRIAILLLGLGLMIIGSIGLFFGRLIKAAVSRQREFLADASAVQFTRNPHGLSGALKKIAGFRAGALQKNPRAEECSHMFFRNGINNWFQLFATHPPLEERIRRVDPQALNPDEHLTEADAPLTNPRDPEGDEVASELVAPLASSQSHRRDTPSPKILSERSIPSQQGILTHIGLADEQTLSSAQTFLKNVPDQIIDLTRNPFSARAIPLSFLICPEPAIQTAQFQIIQNNLEPAFVELLQRIQPILSGLDEELRLPLIDLSLSALRQMSPSQYEPFRNTVQLVIEADGKLQLFEFIIQRMVLRHLDRIYLKRPLPRIRFRNLDQVSNSLCIVLGAVAYSGTNSEQELQETYGAAIRSLDHPRLNATALPNGHLALCDLDRALSNLSQCSPPLKKQIIEACLTCVTHDGRILVREAELFRGIADALDVPVNLLIPAPSAA